MVIPRNQPPNPLEPRRPPPNHPLTKRPRLASEKILIRGLALDNRIPAFSHQVPPPTLNLTLRNQHVDPAIIEVYPQNVAVFEDRQVSVFGCFGARVEDAGGAGRAGLAAVTDAGEGVGETALEEVAGGCHFGEVLVGGTSGRREGNDLLLTTSAAPGYPIGPVPRITRIVRSSMSAVSIREW